MTHSPPAVERDLTYRRIDPSTDTALAYQNYRETCMTSFGSARQCMTPAGYSLWLARRVEEFPDGHVLAILRGQVVGQLELQVPYGLDRGYVNLFYIAPPWRRLGFGRRLHDFAMRYFRGWEAEWIDLHVSPTNTPAVGFYRSLGYRVAEIEPGPRGMWRMERAVIR
jgi:ribosomal protein S18 acetylase RimI-like enzyme